MLAAALDSGVKAILTSCGTSPGRRAIADLARWLRRRIGRAEVTADPRRA
ncbi:hypothetical protein ACTMTI_20985 [Nonomuraea sp. H19]